MFRKLVVPALVASVLSMPALAGDVVQYRESDRVDPRDVARILGRGAGEPVALPQAIKWRSLRVMDQPATSEQAETAVQQVTAEASKPKRADSLALPVQFAFGSAMILPQARDQLDAVAEGIKMLPGSQAVTIEGHTDAVGSDMYNLQLSNRRAVAVKQYLVSVHGIEGERLKTLGFGEYRPINEQDPFAAENRRVQFRGG